MSWIRKLFGKGESQGTDREAESSGAEGASWLEPDNPGNPFGVRLLDLMSNLQLTSTTEDPALAERSISWRAGQQHRLKPLTEGAELACDLRYPAADELPDGMLFLPEAMEDKWVFAWVDGEIRVARSWTGDTRIVARATFNSGSLAVSSISFSKDSGLDVFGDPTMAFDWMIRTHPLGQRVPFPVDENGGTVLAQAPLTAFSSYGHRLFCATVDYSFPDSQGSLCSDGKVVAAIQQGDLDALTALADEGASLTAPSTLDGYRPLHIALVAKSRDLASALLSRGVDVNQTSLKGVTALQAAVSVECSPELLKYLLDHGANVEAGDSSGFRPLHEAAQHNSPSCIGALLTSGAELEARTNNGLTALHIACALGSLDAAKTLHAAGADVRARAPMGDALEIALAEEKAEVADWLRSLH